MNRWTTRAAALCVVVVPISSSFAVSPLPVVAGQPHITDGIATPNEWPTPTSNQQFFPFVPSNGSGGAFLDVDQGSSTGGPAAAGNFGSNLYLLYDYVHDTTIPTPNSYFDVFFEVAPDSSDYLVRIMGNNSFQAFEKPIGTPAPTPGGGFDPTQAPWTPLTAADLSLANFHGAIGFGPSPNSPTPHQIAEFDLTIDNTGGNGKADGVYSPLPAFWSASTGNQVGNSVIDDPPISSGIFQLNPNGTTLVVPVLGANGDPILQSLPEPGSLLLLGAFGFGLVTRRRRRTA